MKKAAIIILLVIVVSASMYFIGTNLPAKKQSALLSQVMPGALSAAHSKLSTDCASCHTPAKGIDDAKCITCHGDNKALLQRQPTAFHSMIANCATCHTEHQGVDANLKVMNHEALAKIGAKIIGDGKSTSTMLDNQHLPANHPNVSSAVSRLNCATCHSTKDKHVGLLGQNCASCHAAEQWTIPEFQHPSVNSINCAQCHQAPPSHYMEHFKMISQKIARQETAQINQCYSCHQTTSWNDIKGVGYYKHH